MNEDGLYTSQEEMVGDWLDFFQKVRHRSVYKPGSKQGKAVSEIAIEEEDLNSRTKATLDEGILDDEPFVEYVKSKELNLLEIKIIIRMYLDYLSHGPMRGETILSILQKILANSRTAYIERKNILEKNTLFECGALEPEHRRRTGKSYGKTYVVSDEVIALLEGNRHELMEGEVENYETERSVFDIIEPSKNLEDVILSEETEEMVEIALKQIEKKDIFLDEWGLGEKFEKGRGLVMMFYGEPGTGKTLTAEAMAGELDYRLFVVSLPDVLNPFYGVTEKNIKKIFKQASEEDDCLLLLDEVDAFISERTKGGTYMDSSHNRKVSLFLRLIENYDGVAILTTNLADVLDKALERRVSLKIKFDRPDEKMRKEIWNLLLPDTLPVTEGIDFEELSRNYELSGGEIKNVIMNAARLALVKDDPEITQADLEFAIEKENIEEENKAGFLN